MQRLEYDVDSVIDKRTELGHPAVDWVGSRLRLAAEVSLGVVNSFRTG